MMVGNLIVPLIIALSESITRAISPPEATWETGCNGVPRLAEKRKTTWSAPLAESGAGLTSTSKRTLGMPSGTRRACISASTLRAEAVRDNVSC